MNLEQDIEQRLKNEESISIIDPKGDLGLYRGMQKMIYKANRNKNKNKIRKTNKKRQAKKLVK